MVEPETVVQLVISTGPAPRVVPNLVGRPVAEARTELEAMGLTLAESEQVFSDDIGLGSIVAQNIPEGTEVARGSGVVVAVSRGPDLVIFPDLSAATTFEQAAAASDRRRLPAGAHLRRRSGGDPERHDRRRGPGHGRDLSPRHGRRVHRSVASRRQGARVATVRPSPGNSAASGRDVDDRTRGSRRRRHRRRSRARARARAAARHSGRRRRGQRPRRRQRRQRAATPPRLPRSPPRSGRMAGRRLPATTTSPSWDGAAIGDRAGDRDLRRPRHRSSTTPASCATRRSSTCPRPTSTRSSAST